MGARPRIADERRGDEEQKRSPFLLPWEELTTTIQGNDRTAMVGLAKALARAGNEVYRLEPITDAEDLAPSADHE